MYLIVAITFAPALRIKKFFNPRLHLIQEKIDLKYLRVSDTWHMHPYIAKYKCTQNIVKKCDCTATISHTGVWNSVSSESSNIIVFNALH